MRLGLNILLGRSVPRASRPNIVRGQRPCIIRNYLHLAANLLMAEGVGHDNDGINRAKEDQITGNRRVPHGRLILIERAPHAADRAHNKSGVAGESDVECAEDRLHENRGQRRAIGIFGSIEFDLFATTEGEGVPNSVRTDALFRGEGDHRFDFDSLSLDQCDLYGFSVDMNRHRLQ